MAPVYGKTHYVQVCNLHWNKIYEYLSNFTTLKALLCFGLHLSIPRILYESQTPWAHIYHKWHFLSKEPSYSKHNSWKLSILALALENALHYHYHWRIRALLSDEFTDEFDFSFHSHRVTTRPGYVGTRPGYYATYVVVPSYDTLHDDFSGEIPNEGNAAYLVSSSI